MRALIRSIVAAASLQSGSNRQVLLVLANKLEGDLRLMMESNHPKEGVAALREVNSTVARVHAEYLRMQIPTPFAMEVERKVPIKTK